ncbi:ParA family protein [Nibrella saemangeumensis]|uniref:ParA family protein n=1 Tax=Nibrella saemangeumensis TaxID=1084526 RepID=A0ABP8NBD5_9BACT
MATFISIFSQKGGVGKTTLTMVLATHFAVVEKRKVIVIDGDHPQHNFFHERELEMAKAEQNEAFRKSVEAQGVEPYPVLEASLSDLALFIDHFRKEGGDEIVFIDLPGTVNTPGYMDVVNRLDYGILPMEADKFTFVSGLQTLNAVYDQLQEGKTKIKMFMLWNKYMERERQNIYTTINAQIQEAGFVTVLHNRVKHSVLWKNQRSTLIPEVSIKPVADEISTLLFETKKVPKKNVLKTAPANL